MDEFSEFAEALNACKVGWEQKLPGVKIFYSLDDDRSDLTTVIFNLHLLEVPLDCRRHGYGERIMGELTLICDRYNIHMKLEATSIVGTPLPVLVSFYCQHKFYPVGTVIENTSVKMERIPSWVSL